MNMCHFTASKGKTESAKLSNERLLVFVFAKAMPLNIERHPWEPLDSMPDPCLCDVVLQQKYALDAQRT